jgi:glucan phosphoethanolaminetransferase (alkaline phosphatase superfamily)
MLTKRFVIELIKLEHLCKVYLYMYFNIIFLTHNIQNNVSEWSDMFTRGLLFQLASTIIIQLSMLV